MYSTHIQSTGTQTYIQYITSNNNIPAQENSLSSLALRFVDQKKFKDISGTDIKCEYFIFSCQDILKQNILQSITIIFHNRKGTGTTRRKST